MKKMRMVIGAAAMGLAAALTASGAAIEIRSDYPAGNVKVEKIDEASNTVVLRPDLRDTRGNWFHWDFTVRRSRGDRPAARTIHFQFPKNGFDYLSSLGPAISKDGGKTWRWLNADGRRHEPNNAFDYTFGADENETRFAMSIPYTQKDWDAASARWRGKEGVRFDVLCKSQSGRRETELLRIPCRKGNAKWLFAFTARHHACETTANPVMEGIIDEILSGSPEGEWIRDHADCVFIPFMDKDGVEDGDQGKNRRPHDHNRDYVAGIYTSVRAFKELLVRESHGKKIVFYDLHSPHVRSHRNCPEQDCAFTFETPYPRNSARVNEFRRLWAELSKGCALAYDGKNDIPAGKGHAAKMERDRLAGLVSSRQWVEAQPNCWASICCEFGYSLCNGIYSQDGGRELGHNLLKAAVRTVKQPGPTKPKGTDGGKGAFRAVSPDGKNEIRLETTPDGIAYSVWRNGRTLVEPTPISLTTREHGRMNGVGAKPTATARKVEGTLPTPIYKKARVDLAANETRVDFGNWAVVLHARNDGVAWRFETKYRDMVHITAEDTNVRFPKDSSLCYGQVGGFETSFETPAKIGPVASVKSGHPQIVIIPFTAVVPGAGVVAVTESDLFDYPGLNFYRKDAESDMLCSWQAGVPSETVRKSRWIRVKKRHSYLAKTNGTRAYPWRVFVLGDSPSDLVSADIVYALARPSCLNDTSWVRPGLVQWDWWHGFKITDVPGLKTGCNYETYKAYIDFAAANGVGYIIMDEGWSERLNLDKPRAEANVEGVIKYGQEKGVGVILWAAWSMLSTPEDRARIFDRYAAMGAKGFKIDFMDRDDQLLERFLYETAADAAARKLVVMYHGIHKPTGLCRTFPNVLNYEGVYGLEQGHSNGGRKVVVSNDVNLVYTRMVAGAMDYTPGAMRNRAFDAPAFQKGKEASACYGTRCHQLALFPIFEAPVQMLCDSPTQYRSAPECAAFLTKVPTVWDETKGVAGEIGKFASVARRKGRDWWLGAITNWEARELVLPTGFLCGGEWTVEAFEDAPDADVNAEHYVRRTFTVTAGEPLKVRLSRGGGFAARFTPVR